MLKTFDVLARVGFATRGAVYILVGGLAVLAALGRGGATTDSKGALTTVLTQPLGGVILICIAAGLFFFSAWRFAQAILNADHLGASWKERFRRIGYGIGGLVNTGLAVSATGIALGYALSESSEQKARDWTEYFLSLPFGRWIVGVTGAIIIAIGVAIAIRSAKANFGTTLRLKHEVEKWALPLGRAGFLARAIVLLMVGGFLIFAAWTSNPSQARGLAGALRSVQEQPFGWVLFGMLATGLFLFGVFQFILAKYRRIDAPACLLK